MTQDPENLNRKQLGRRIFIGVVVAAVVALLLVTLDTEQNPRTDDASVRANFIEIAPEVSGRLVQLPVKDNGSRVTCYSLLIHATTSMPCNRRFLIRRI
jgi:multidrug efflux system membrane fusion protein